MRELTPMDSPARIFAVTGDAVARFRLYEPKPEFALEGYQVRCIATDPRDPERVYVGTMGNGLWFSTDGGASWREAGPSIDAPTVLSVAVSRSDERAGVSVVYAGTEPATSIGPRTADSAGNCCQLSASCRARRAGPSRLARGRITSARSRSTRPIRSRSQSGSSWAG